MNTTSQVNKCNTRNRPVKTNISPENKPTPQLTLIKNLSKLVIEIVNAKFGGDQDLTHFLISYYDNTSNNVFTSGLFSGKNENQRKDIIQKHCEMFTYKQPGNKSRISYFRGPKDMNLTIDLNSIEKTLNFAYLMYLDMEHDGTLPMIFDDKNNKNKKMKKMTFDDFCKGSYSDGKKEIKTPVWYFFGSGINIESKVTPFISKMKEIMGTAATGKESRIKASFEKIYDKSNAVKNAIELNRSEVTPYIIKKPNLLYWLVDQEDKARTATRMINRTAQTVSRPAYTTNNIQSQRIKSIYPMITVANFMDPGVDLIIDSAKADSELVMKEEPTSRLTYNYHQPKFTIKHELGWTNLEVYYSQQLDKNVKGTTKRIGRGYGIYLSNSTQKRRYQNKKDPECVFRLTGKISKDAAKSKNTSQARLSKFLGDFLQVLTAVRTIKNTQNRDTYHYALTTGDTMMANMFLYICTVEGITPKLWFLTSSQGAAKVIGLNNIIKKPNRQNAGRPGSQITGVPSERPNSERVNNKNTATSSGKKNGKKNGNNGVAGMPQNRRLNSVLEGSGNSNNTTTSGKKNGKKNGNNGLARMIMTSQGQNQNKRTPTPSVLEGSGNSNNTTTSGKKNGKKNGNNGLARMIMTSQGQNQNKRTPIQIRNSNNNNGSPPVRGPNAQSGVGSRNSIAGNNKNGNVSSGNSQPSAEQRKKLLKNLKSKRVPNRTIESLMKNYNNKKMSYNQVIREGNNIGQKIIAGNRAQRMGTLRNRP